MTAFVFLLSGLMYSICMLWWWYLFIQDKDCIFITRHILIICGGNLNKIWIKEDVRQNLSFVWFISYVHVGEQVLHRYTATAQELSPWTRASTTLNTFTNEWACHVYRWFTDWLIPYPVNDNPTVTVVLLLYTHLYGMEALKVAYHTGSRGQNKAKLSSL